MADVRAGGAFIDFSARFDGLNKAIKQAGARVRGFGNDILSVGSRVAGVGALLSAPFIAASVAFAKTGDELAKISRRTGVAVQSISELRNAIELSGGSSNTFEKALIGLSRGLFDAQNGTGELLRALDSVDVALEEVTGDSPEETFLKIGEVIRNIEDPLKKSAVAMRAFGKAGAQLIPFFDAGSEAIENMRKEARDLGLVLDEETAARAERLTDQMARVRNVFTGVSNVVSAVLEPALSKLAEVFIQIGKDTVAFIRENERLIKISAAVVAGITAIGVAIVSLGVTFVGLGIAIQGFATTITFLTKTFIPLGVAMLKIATISTILVGSLVILADTIAGLFGLENYDIIGFIKGFEIAGTSIGTWIQIGVNQAFLEFQKLSDAALKTVDFVISAFRTFPTSVVALFTQGITAVQRIFVSFASFVAGVYQDILGFIGDILGQLPLVGNELKGIVDEIVNISKTADRFLSDNLQKLEKINEERTNLASSAIQQDLDERGATRAQEQREELTNQLQEDLNNVNAALLRDDANRESSQEKLTKALDELKQGVVDFDIQGLLNRGGIDLNIDDLASAFNNISIPDIQQASSDGLSGSALSQTAEGTFSGLGVGALNAERAITDEQKETNRILIAQNDILRNNQSRPIVLGD